MKSGAESHGIVTESIALLASIPQQIAPFTGDQARSGSKVGGRYLPMYKDTGKLWFVMDETGTGVEMPPRFGPPVPFHLMQHRAADAARSTDWVYFIGGDSGAIKIGYSCNAEDRLRTIQSYSPIKLRILAKRRGGPERESAYHLQFAAHRLHGEWFEPHPDILAEIDRLSPALPVGDE